MAGDSINNGADDDASGVVAILEIARMLESGPAPRRTVIVAAMTGEEVGLLGTNWFVRHPWRPLTQIVGNLEVEMIGRPDSLIGGFGKTWLTGYERSSLGEMLAAGGIPIVADPRLSQNFFMRSDNIAFAYEGIVAHTLSTFNLHTDYHRPSDEIEKMDLAAHGGGHSGGGTRHPDHDRWTQADLERGWPPGARTPPRSVFWGAGGGSASLPAPPPAPAIRATFAASAASAAFAAPAPCSPPPIGTEVPPLRPRLAKFRLQFRQRVGQQRGVITPRHDKPNWSVERREVQHRQLTCLALAQPEPGRRFTVAPHLVFDGDRVALEAHRPRQRLQRCPVGGGNERGQVEHHRGPLESGPGIDLPAAGPPGAPEAPASESAASAPPERR